MNMGPDETPNHNPSSGGEEQGQAGQRNRRRGRGRRGRGRRGRPRSSAPGDSESPRQSSDDARASGIAPEETAQEIEREHAEMAERQEIEQEFESEAPSPAPADSETANWDEPVSEPELPEDEHRDEPGPEEIRAVAEKASERPAPRERQQPTPQPPAPRKDFRPASPMSIQEAIDEVNQIIDALRNALDDMDEVLETLEIAERQKDADEREIEALKRSLRQIQRPREQHHKH